MSELCRHLSEDSDAIASGCSEEDIDVENCDDEILSAQDIVGQKVSISATANAGGKQRFKEGDKSTDAVRRHRRHSRRGLWSVEEVALFKNGIDLFGRKWTKIADLMQNRSVQQVRTFAKKYFKGNDNIPLGKESCASSVVFISQADSDTAVDVDDDDETVDVATTGHRAEYISRDCSPPDQLQSMNDSSVVKLEHVESGGKEAAPSTRQGESRCEMTDEETPSHRMTTVPIKNEDAERESEPHSSAEESCIPGGMDPLRSNHADVDDHDCSRTGHVALPDSNVSRTQDSAGDDVCSVSSADLLPDNNLNGGSRGSDFGDCSPGTIVPDDNYVGEQLTRDPKEANGGWENHVDETSAGHDDDAGERGTLGEEETLLPRVELILDQNEISEAERQRNEEFFSGSASKTPERYRRIRNTILSLWKKERPNYVSKMKVRSSLKACGDVNAIGRIHDYLEQSGAINFGCPESQRMRVVKPSRVERNAGWKQSRDWGDGLRPRKERKPLAEDQWMDVSESEGMTIEHLPVDGQPQAASQRVDASAGNSIKRKRKAPRNPNPFKLIPCRTFQSDAVAPFTVSVAQSCLVLLDFHSHLSSSEVIGLVGGSYDSERRHLVVTRISPCENVGSDMQCEMDAVSQTRAMTQLGDQGVSVVGWYHSHPTFAPTPSLRDIETQTSFQKWFSRDAVPFVGIIVSPFYGRQGQQRSSVSCLTVSDELDKTTTYNVPYRFNFTSSCDLDDAHVRAWIDAELRHCLDVVPDSNEFLSSREFCDASAMALLMQSIESRLGDSASEHNEDVLLNVRTILQSSNARIT